MRTKSQIAADSKQNPLENRSTEQREHSADLIIHLRLTINVFQLQQSNFNVFYDSYVTATALSKVHRTYWMGRIG